MCQDSLDVQNIHSLDPDCVKKYVAHLMNVIAAPSKWDVCTVITYYNFFKGLVGFYRSGAVWGSVFIHDRSWCKTFSRSWI